MKKGGNMKTQVCSLPVQYGQLIDVNSTASFDGVAGLQVEMDCCLLENSAQKDTMLD